MTSKIAWRVQEELFGFFSRYSALRFQSAERIFFDHAPFRRWNRHCHFSGAGGLLPTGPPLPRDAASSSGRSLLVAAPPPSPPRKPPPGPTCPSGHRLGCRLPALQRAQAAGLGDSLDWPARGCGGPREHPSRNVQQRTCAGQAQPAATPAARLGVGVSLSELLKFAPESMTE